MTIAYLAVLLLAAAIRLHNAFAYNPLWGYDGGAHLAYLEVLRAHHRLPTPEETYLAWHEPLYYVLAALTSGAGLKIFQALLGVFFVGSIGWLAYEITRRRSVALFAISTTAVLPPAVLLSNFPTNELLAQTLFVVALTVTIRSLRAKRSNPDTSSGLLRHGVYPVPRHGVPRNDKMAILLGLLLAAAQWTKLSAIIVVAAVTLTLLATAWSRRSFALLRMTGIVFGIWFILSFPWHVYRQTHLGGAFRINNVETPSAQGHPLRFYIWFNRDVLAFPYWQAGADSFWSILFASSFADYDNLHGNVDRDNTLPSPQKLLTGSGRYVPIDRFASALALTRYSLVFVPIAILGLLAAWRRRRSPDTLLLLVFVFLSLAALIYNASRFSYLERGTLKPIFVLSALIVPIMLGYDALIRRFGRYVVIALGGIVALYIVFALPLIVIPAF